MDVFSSAPNDAYSHHVPRGERQVSFPPQQAPNRLPEEETAAPVEADRSAFRVSHRPNLTVRAQDGVEDDEDGVEAGYSRFINAHLASIATLVRRWIGHANDTPAAKGVKLPLNAKYSGEDDPEKFYSFLKDLLTYLFFGRISGPEYVQDQVLITGQTLHGPARSWYEYEVLQDDMVRWTMVTLMCELFKQFISPAHVHTPQANYSRVKYAADTGVSQFASSLTHYARLLPQYPTQYELNKKFLRGIPMVITKHLLRDLKLSAELTRFEVLKNEAVLYEASSKYADTLYKEIAAEPSQSKGKTATATTAPASNESAGSSEKTKGGTNQAGRRLISRTVYRVPKSSYEQARNASGGAVSAAPRPKSDKSGIRCHNCQQLGHYKSECPTADGSKRLMANIVLEQDETVGSDAGRDEATEDTPGHTSSDEESTYEEVIEEYVNEEDDLPNSQYDSDEEIDQLDSDSEDGGMIVHHMHAMRAVLRPASPMECTEDEEEDLRPSYITGMWPLPRVGQRPNASKAAPELYSMELETYHRRRHALQTTREHNRVVREYSGRLERMRDRVIRLEDQLRLARHDRDLLERRNGELAEQLDGARTRTWEAQEGLATAEHKFQIMLVHRDALIEEHLGLDEVRVAHELDSQVCAIATDVTESEVTDAIGTSWSREEALPWGLRGYSTNPLSTAVPIDDASSDEVSSDETDSDADSGDEPPSTSARLGVTMEEVPESDDEYIGLDYDSDCSLPALESVSDTSEEELDSESEDESSDDEHTIDVSPRNPYRVRREAQFMARNVARSPVQNNIRPKNAQSVQRPKPSPNAMMCMTTYGEVNGVQALILFDTGSTCDSITPTLATAAKVKAVALDPPFTLQLGCVGSKSKVSWGATHSLTLGDVTIPTMYSDIVNAAGYDMILGTPFMHDHGVMLDFKRGVIAFDGYELKALTRSEAEELKAPFPMPTAIETGENILPAAMLSKTPPKDHQLIDDILNERVTMTHPAYDPKAPVRTVGSAEKEGKTSHASGKRTFSRATSSRPLAFKINASQTAENGVGPSTSG
ncbi:unnamed protein product [Peniophora sp. CBMAI 1063]|nr:unnamed protein product [Peniophora sp. CBMAI 1063]